MKDNIVQVLYQDDDLIVINKPAGMIVNNADTSKNEFTIQDYILENYKLKSTGVDNPEFLSRGGIVHRLDKETSGALIIALNDKAFVALQKQFKQKEVKKIYVALCHGKIVEEGEINVPIGRLPWNRMRFGVIPKGRESYTKFKTISYKIFPIGKKNEILSFVEVYPQSGRTHQIRVHFQYVKHPLFSDLLYAGRKISLQDRALLPRHFLHASVITFKHPVTGKELRVEAPLPSDLSVFLSKLQNLKSV